MPSCELWSGTPDLIRDGVLHLSAYEGDPADIHGLLESADGVLEF